MEAEIIRGKFQHFKQPPEPERQAKLEAAQAEDLGLRMNMWLTHAEKEIGLRNARAMLVSALGWLDMRAQYNSKNGKQS